MAGCGKSYEIAEKMDSNSLVVSMVRSPITAIQGELLAMKGKSLLNKVQTLERACNSLGN